MKKKSFILICCALLLGAMTSGCARSEKSNQGEADLEGTITISGAFALYPLVVRWGEEFQALHPDVRFDISAGGAGKGMSDALGGAVDIGMVSREIYPEETSQGAFSISVARDAVFLTINEDNPVRNDLLQEGFSRNDLVAIFVTGEYTSWGQVVDRPEITDPIHIFTRSDACGAAETLAQYLGSHQEDLLGIGTYGDPGLLEAVIKDPHGIGYNNLNYAYDFTTGLPVEGALVIPLDVNENGQVDPGERLDSKSQALEAVHFGTYPSPPARDLNLVTRGQPTGLTGIFLEWVLSEGQQFIPEAGYIPMAEDILAEQRLRMGD